MLLSAFSIPVSVQASDYYVQGVDVSYHNGDVDFTALKSQGYNYAIIRLGYYNHLDSKFFEYVTNAVNAGMNFGVYLYSYAVNSQEAEIEAQFVIDTLAQLSTEQKALMTYPIAYDVEDKLISANLDKASITANILLFTNKMKQNGYDSMVYANTNWFTNYIDINTLVQNNIKLWCANYNSSPVSTGSMLIGDTGISAYMWQYSNDVIDKNVMMYYDSADCNISLSYTKTTYNSKKKEPTVTVYNKYGEKVSSDYYTVSYKNNKKPGTATVTVTFSGIYFGEKTATFKIKPKKTSVKKVQSSSKKQITVKWKKDSLVSGYEIQYSTSSKFTSKKTKKVTVSKKNSKKTIKKLKSGKKYYVRIRSYKTSNGKKIYSEWSSKKSVKVK